MGSPDFDVLAVARMQIFITRCLMISVSHNTVSVQLNHGRKRKYAGRTFTATGHSALLRLAYRFACYKLLNPANQGDSFYIVKSDRSL
jgi:hypothetical protein